MFLVFFILVIFLYIYFFYIYIFASGEKKSFIQGTFRDTFFISSFCLGKFIIFSCQKYQNILQIRKKYRLRE